MAFIEFAKFPAGQEVKVRILPLGGGEGWSLPDWYALAAAAGAQRREAVRPTETLFVGGEIYGRRHRRLAVAKTPALEFEIDCFKDTLAPPSMFRTRRLMLDVWRRYVFKEDR